MDEVRKKNTKCQKVKFPYLKFFTGDWLKDPRLSLCSPIARGVWIDLICAMHELDQSGELCGTTEDLARLARCSTVELVHAISDLQNKRAADVSQRNGVWTIANRRMRKEAEQRRKRAIAGSLGGSKTQAKRQPTPDYDCDSDSDALERVREFSRGEGITQSDADWFYWKGKGNGWTNRGVPILDWKATLRSWNRGGYLPSQRSSQPSRNSQRSMSAFEIEKRLAAISEEINAIWKRNGSKRVEGDGIDELKKRRTELHSQLVA